jgi:tetratricopeptide (TPR) repeat protein
VTPAPAAIVPGTPPPDRGREAAMLQTLQPPKRPWGLYAAGAAILLVGAWFLRPQPRTDKKDAPWLERSVPAARPAVAVERAAPPAEKGGEPPKAAEPQKTDDSRKAALPAEVGGTPASDQLYAKALEQGEAQLRRGKYRSAISHFQRAVKEKPQAVPALLALGDAFLEADKPRSALPPLELAARLDGQSGRAQLLLGTAYQSLGRNGQALKAYRRYLELEPQGEFSRDVRLILANLSQ